MTVEVSDGFAMLKVQTEADAALVAALAREIWTEHYTPLIGPAQVDYMLTTIQSPAAITRQLREGYDYRILESGGEYAGYFAVRAEPDTRALFLSKLYVRKAMRRRAIARRAIEWMSVHAQALELDRICLTVNRHNFALQVYERLGFEIVEDVVTDIGGGFVMDDYRLEKRLK
jgi:GNAT superfamily N-acetyltransferase